MYDYTKALIVKASNNENLFLKELNKAMKMLLPYEKEKLINWLFYFTADKPQIQKWFYKHLDKNILVS